MSGQVGFALTVQTVRPKVNKCHTLNDKKESVPSKPRRFSISFCKTLGKQFVSFRCLGAKTLQFNREVCCVATDLIPGRYEEACGLCCRNLLRQVQSSTLSISSPIGSSSAFARKSSPDKSRCSTAKHSVQQSVILRATERHTRSTTREARLFVSTLPLRPFRCNIAQGPGFTFRYPIRTDNFKRSIRRFRLTPGRFCGKTFEKHKS